MNHLSILAFAAVASTCHGIVWAGVVDRPEDTRAGSRVDAREARPAPPYADAPAVTARIAALPDRTGMNLGDAGMTGKHLEPWREPFYRNGPDGRDYCIKMAYNPDRKTAFFCGGNHGTPHKLSDAWEYHLGSYPSTESALVLTGCAGFG